MIFIHVSRISHPLENRQSINRYTSDEANIHDDLSTIQTAINSQTENWLKTFLIPNRKAVFTQGYWKIPCYEGPQNVSSSLTKNADPQYDFPDVNGEVINLRSRYQNCYYTRTPPLVDVFWSFVYKLGAQSYFSYKTISITLRVLSLFFLLVFLKKWHSSLSILIGGIIFSTFYYQITWTSSLYFQPISYFLLSIFGDVKTLV